MISHRSADRARSLCSDVQAPEVALLAPKTILLRNRRRPAGAGLRLQPGNPRTRSPIVSRSVRRRSDSTSRVFRSKAILSRLPPADRHFELPSSPRDVGGSGEAVEEQGRERDKRLRYDKSWRRLEGRSMFASFSRNHQVASPSLRGGLVAAVALASIALRRPHRPRLSPSPPATSRPTPCRPGSPRSTSSRPGRRARPVHPGGNGARVSGTIPVAPGDLYVEVGGVGECNGSGTAAMGDGGGAAEFDICLRRRQLLRYPVRRVAELAADCRRRGAVAERRPTPAGAGQPGGGAGGGGAGTNIAGGAGGSGGSGGGAAAPVSPERSVPAGAARPGAAAAASRGRRRRLDQIGPGAFDTYGGGGGSSLVPAGGSGPLVTSALACVEDLAVHDPRHRGGREAHRHSGDDVICGLGGNDRINGTRRQRHATRAVRATTR